MCEHCQSVTFVGTVALTSSGLAQEKILQHEFPLPAGERTAADPTVYLAVDCLRSSFDFDDLIKSFAAWASECIECPRPATSHGTSPLANASTYDVTLP